MSRLLSSARFRRRVVRWGGAAGVIAVAVLIGIRYANTGVKLEKPTGGPVQTVPPTPKTVRRSAAEMASVRGVAEHFIQTAVYRRHLDEAWALAAPSMRQGMTLSDWRTGDIPVVPYPAKDVADIKWRLDYSFKKLIGMKIAFVPKPGASQTGLVASMELTSYGSGAHRRWLVDAWVPLGGGQALRSAIRGHGLDQPVASTQPRLSSTWLILPFAVIGGIMLALPIGLGVRGWRRHARAQRAYSSTSRPS